MQPFCPAVQGGSSGPTPFVRPSRKHRVGAEHPPYSARQKSLGHGKGEKSSKPTPAMQAKKGRGYKPPAPPAEWHRQGLVPTRCVGLVNHARISLAGPSLMEAARMRRRWAGGRGLRMHTCCSIGCAMDAKVPEPASATSRLPGLLVLPDGVSAAGRPGACGQTGRPGRRPPDSPGRPWRVRGSRRVPSRPSARRRSGQRPRLQ